MGRAPPSGGRGGRCATSAIGTGAIGAAPGRRYRFVVEGALLWVQIAMGLNFLAVAPLFPLIIEDYGVDNATVSLLVGAGALAVGVMNIPGGVLAARFGWRRMTVAGGVLMSSTALSPFAESFAVLLALRLAFSVGAAICLGALPGAVMSWFPQRELPVVNGVNIVGQSLGVTASVFAAALIADLLGWRGALSAFGFVALAGTIVFALLARDPARPAGAPVRAPFSVADLRAAMRERSTLLLGLGFGGGAGAFIAFSSWLPTYYRQEFGFSLEQAGAAAAIPSFCGIFGSLLGSALPVGLGRRRPWIVLAGLTMPVTALGCIASDAAFVLYPSLALFGLMAWLYVPSALTMPMELRGMTLERATVAVATVLAMVNVSGFLTPLLVGAMRDLGGGYAAGLAVCALLPSTLVVSGLLLPETGPRGRPRPAAPPDPA